MNYLNTFVILTALLPAAMATPAATEFRRERAYLSDRPRLGMARSGFGRARIYALGCIADSRRGRQGASFVGRWPEPNVDPAWRKSSEIAHYVGDKPEGPFKFHDVALRGTGTNTWDKFAPANPEVRKFGDTYALLYIANNDYHQPPHPAISELAWRCRKSLDGPWRKVGRDGLILDLTGHKTLDPRQPGRESNTVAGWRESSPLLQIALPGPARHGLRRGA